MIVCELCGWIPDPKSNTWVDGKVSPLQQVLTHALMHSFPGSVNELRAPHPRRFVG
ncbi:MAG: hypothetical protein ACREEC_04720 [Thermoplasmata archaeon]